MLASIGLLYVAMTRARDRFIVFRPAMEGWRGPECQRWRAAVHEALARRGQD